MKILILASPADVHAEAVGRHLKEMGAQVDFFRYEDFMLSSAALRLGTKDRLCLLERADVNLDLRTYDSIWNRRPGRIRAGKFVEGWISDMAEMEARGAVDGMMRSLSCLWMNFPGNDAAATSKLWQLEVAEEVGLSIPETLVTNKPELVRQFYESCGGEVIYKFMHELSSFYIPAAELPAGIPTLPLRKEDLPFVDQVVHCPTLFQRRIAKAVELRVTVVGRKIFSISIDSQSGRGTVDWRSDYSVEMTPCDLPIDVEKKVLVLMRRLKLNYGAIDFIKTPDGDYVFIEINSGGQYMWVEQVTPHKISLEIARFLMHKTEAIIPQGMHDFYQAVST
jgi:hypothetical protein